jgi:hypothetical protein
MAAIPAVVGSVPRAAAVPAVAAVVTGIRVMVAVVTEMVGAGSCRIASIIMWLTQQQQQRQRQQQQGKLQSLLLLRCSC